MIKKIFLALLLLLILCIAGITFIIYTNSGLKFAVTMAEKFMPELKIGQVEGTLSDLSLVNLSYQMPGVDVKAERLNLSVSKSCLIKGKVCINNIALENSQINIDTSLLPPSAETTDDTPVKLSSPIPIQLQQASFSNMTLMMDGIQVNFEKLTTKADWIKRDLILYPTEINALRVIVPKPRESDTKTAAPQSSSEVNKPLGQQLADIFSQPLLKELSPIDLLLDIQIMGFVGHDWQINYNDHNYVLDEIALKASTKKSTVTIDQFVIKGPEINTNIKGTAQLDASWPLNIGLDADVVLPEGKQTLSLTAQGDVFNKITVKAQGGGLVTATLAAETSLATKGLPMAITLTSPIIQWPLQGKADYQAKDITIKLDGNVDAYNLSLKTAVMSEVLPAVVTDILLEGQGNLTEFQLAHLVLSAFDGTLQTTGKINWADKIQWDVQIKADKINTASQLPEYPMVISGGFQTKGFWQNETWDVAVSDLSLTGNMKKRPINIVGNLNGDSSGIWNFDNVDAVWGDNTLKINGKASQTEMVNINMDINARNLSHILPELSGAIIGKADINGSLVKPVAKIDLQANNLKWQTWGVKQVNLSANMKSESQINGDVSLNISTLSGDGIAYSKIIVDLKGDETNHTLKIQTKGEPTEGNVAITGKFDRNQLVWQGKLYDSKLSSPIGVWNQNKAAQIDYGIKANELTVSAHCWETKASKVCLPKPAIIGSKGHVEIALDKFDLLVANKFTGQGLKMRGIVSGNVKTDWQPNQSIPEVVGTLKSKDFKLYLGSGIQTLPISFNQLDLTSTIKDNILDLGLLVQLANNGKIVSSIKVTDPQNKKLLSGKFTIDRITMDILKPLLQKQDHVNGSLNGTLTFGGTLTNPLVNGSLGISNLKILAGMMPLEVTDGNVNVQFSGQESRLNGVIKSGDGSLNLAGQANWQDIENWSAKMTAKGDSISIDAKPIVAMKFTPDIEINANAKALDLKGYVNIPWARITVESLPESAVGVSSDEVMLDTAFDPITPKEKKSTAMEINSNLTIRIGDDVSVSAYGLEAKLKGELLVQQGKSGLGLHGEVLIPSGRFNTYGQDLIIRKGQLIFSGPLDQPLLNIEAIRNPKAIEDNVIAGVRVTGLADEPKVEIFSEPSMTQQQALSYILRGQGLSGGDSGDNDMMTSILIGMGASQSGKYIGKVGQMFGIRDLSLDTQGAGSNSQVVVSGYILPDLQIKYGIGIFDALATFTLRYRLMPRLYLEAVSSLDQAVDLIYQFEF